jgi:phosphoribosylamine--glycine ligase
MRILIISKECGSSGLAYKLADESNDVRFFVEDQHFKKVCDGFGVTKTSNWKKDLSWVGKDGLIVFDYTGYGKIQDDLRAEGYAVVGGSQGGEALELKRDFAFRVLEESGMPSLPLYHFTTPKEAVRFIRTHPGPWVVKHNGDVDKTLTYVGRASGDRDVIDLLENYHQNKTAIDSIVIQKKVEGVEIAVARFFNGSDWVGPIEINVEHKDLFNANLGPKTGEMGTLIWFIEGEENSLFNETLAKIKPYLQSTNFRGNIDLNCIVNKNGIFPLEVTTRFGYPAIALEYGLSISPFGELLKAVADGRPYPMKWKKGFGIVVQIAVPPFPYALADGKYSSAGLKIHFAEPLTQEEFSSLYFCDVQLGLTPDRKREYILAGNEGYALCVTGIGSTIREAREKAYSLIDKIIIPKMFYRTDIGLSFMEKDGAMLREWGYV